MSMGIPAMEIITVMDMIPPSTISSGDKYDIMFSCWYFFPATASNPVNFVNPVGSKEE